MCHCSVITLFTACKANSEAMAFLNISFFSYVIGEAENGIDAINKYKLFKPNMVTIDITIPEMGGFDALREIMIYDPKAKVVMLSALGQETKVRMAMMIGAKSFVVKPFKEEHFIKVLNQV